MEIISKIPGFKSNKPIYKLLATVYYSLCIAYIISFRFSMSMVVLVTLPFLVELMRVINNSEKMQLYKLGRNYFIVISTTLVCNIGSTLLMNTIYDIPNVQRKNYKLSEEYYSIEEKNKQLVDDMVNSQEYKNKLQEIKSEKDKLKEENEVLKQEKRNLENKLY